MQTKPIPPTVKKPYGYACGVCITLLLVGRYPANSMACQNDRCAQKGVPFSA